MINVYYLIQIATTFHMKSHVEAVEKILFLLDIRLGGSMLKKLDIGSKVIKASMLANNRLVDGLP